MASNLVKLGIALSGATTVGVGGTAIYLTTSKDEKKVDTKTEDNSPKVTPKRSIIDFLADEKLQLIGDNENSEWTPKWNAFRKEYESKAFPEGWNIADWESKKGIENNAPEEFKALCKSNGAKQINLIIDNNFVLTKKYCTKAKIT